MERVVTLEQALDLVKQLSPVDKVRLIERIVPDIKRELKAARPWRRVDKLFAPALVKMGVIQIMEGRHTFEHLTVEDDLLTGAYTRGRDKKGTKEALEKVFTYFPRLKELRNAKTGYISGG